MTNLPILPYAGTSGHSGSETSRRRAERADKSGETSNRQKTTLEYLADLGNNGATWKEIADHFGWHHGTASGTLSVLHKANRIVRLKKSRHACKIYVLPQYRGNQDVEPYGGKRTTRAQIIREIQAFASEYSHPINDRDVVIVDQLLDFLRGPRVSR